MADKSAVAADDKWQLAKGWRFSGEACGMRGDQGRRDMALFVSDAPANAAGVFTTNLVHAAPVKVSRAAIAEQGGRGFRGVVICSGNANACTGAQGMADAAAMRDLASQAAGTPQGSFLVASTGVIGRKLPMERVRSGIQAAGKTLAPSPDGLAHAAEAIMTTDTRIKVSTRRIDHPKGAITLTGVAKGAAMIGPNMATMLACVFTDAPATHEQLRPALKSAVDRSFHCVSVEGHTSTNDTVFVLANGLAWRPDAGHLDASALQAFNQALEEVCRDLARAIAEDAEGAGHLVVLEVKGAADEHSARTVAHRVAESALVKTAVHGADPNWGRIVSAAGYAGVKFHEEDVSLEVDGIPLFRNGEPVDFDAKAVSAHMRNNRRLTFSLTLGSGPGHCTFYTCDMTEEYIRLNADYTT
jgi:glutamate N-acetyltransferase/amino-acid N-acetyltransferase